MQARLFATIALVMFPTVAFAIDAANPRNETTPEIEANKLRQDDAKAAGTGGGKGAANATSTDSSGSGHVGANGAAAATETAPSSNPTSPDKASAAGTGGGEGASTKDTGQVPRQDTDQKKTP